MKLFWTLIRNNIFYVFVFFPALCGTITSIVKNSVSIHSIMLMFISVKLAIEFSLSVAETDRKVTCRGCITVARKLIVDDVIW